MHYDVAVTGPPLLVLSPLLRIGINVSSKAVEVIQHAVAPIVEDVAFFQKAFGADAADYLEVAEDDVVFVHHEPDCFFMFFFACYAV